MGEILLSLSYLPTAERLTVVVVKAKNLVWSNGKVTAGEGGSVVGIVPFAPREWLPVRTDLLGRATRKSPPALSASLGTHVTDPSPALRADPFVKVYLLQDGRKISKKKTAVKRGDTNPVFNEAMIFSVPAIVLQVRPSWGGTRPSAPQAPQTH